MVLQGNVVEGRKAQAAVRPIDEQRMKSNLRSLANSVDDRIDDLIQSVAVQTRSYQRRIIRSVVEMLAQVDSASNLEADCNRQAENGDAKKVDVKEGDAGEASKHKAVRSVLIESPTGSGKTVMGLAVASLLQRACGIRIGWVAMRRNLLTQTEQENRLRGFGVDLQLISMFDKCPPKVDLLIVDEAQHDGATSMANMHSRIQPRWTLGLSATPYRTDRIKLCFDQVIRDAGIASLIADGYLSPYRHFTIPDYSPEFVAKLLVHQGSRWGKSLVFFHRHEECKQLQHLLSLAGVASDVVTSSSSRDQQLSDFRNGKLEVLINMAILTEGFDCPELQTVFCRPSSRGCTIQMAGRVLRICDAIPCKQIVQCQRTRWPMHRTAMPAEQYLWSEDGWRSIRANQQLDRLTAVARNRIAAADVKLPQLVSMHRRRSNAWYSAIDESS